MKIRYSRGKKSDSLSFEGELTIYTVADAYRELRQIQNFGQKNLTVDLSATEALDGAGLQLLLFVKKTLAEKREFSINAVNPEIQTVFELLQLHWENLTGVAA